MPALYRNYAIALTLFLLVEFVLTCVDKSAFRFQLTNREGKFLTFSENASNWCDFVLNFVFAYILAKHARSWSLEGFFGFFVAMAVIGIVGYLMPLLQDSIVNHSTFFRDGKATAAGVMHQIYWTGGMVIAISYYFLTPGKNVSWQEVTVITLLLMAHTVISIVQPPYQMHGEVHAVAKYSAIGGCIIIPLFAVYLLKFA